jgi:hypothetical protein
VLNCCNVDFYRFISIMSLSINVIFWWILNIVFFSSSDKEMHIYSYIVLQALCSAAHCIKQSLRQTTGPTACEFRITHSHSAWILLLRSSEPQVQVMSMLSLSS